MAWSPDWFRTARKAKGLSQMEIALKVRVNQGLVSHWEQGKSEPDAEMQSRLERLLGAPTTSAHAAAPLPHDP